MSWSKRIPLAELMLERGGSTDPSKSPDREYVLYSIPAYDAGVPEFVRGQEIGSSKKNIKTDDVLLSRIVPHIRRSWIVSEHENAHLLGSGEWIVFRDRRFSPQFLRHFLLSDPFHSQFMQTVAGVGGSLLRARPDHVGRIEIPLPPLDEQRRIAAILDKADQLRQKRKQAIALLDSLTQSIFLEMFGDPVSNPKGWPVGRIGDLLETANYGSSGKAGSKGRFPILRMGNLTNDGRIDINDLKYIDLSVDEIPKYTVRRGDILFNRTNSAELVGKTAVFDLDSEFAYAGYLVRARTNKKAVPEYVSTYLNSGCGKALLRGMAKSIVGMANINAKEMQTISIPIPPLAIQVQFSRRLNSLKAMRESFLPKMGKLDSLFASLQHRAFSGQL